MVCTRQLFLMCDMIIVFLTSGWNNFITLCFLRILAYHTILKQFLPGILKFKSFRIDRFKKFFSMSDWLMNLLVLFESYLPCKSGNRCAVGRRTNIKFGNLCVSHNFALLWLIFKDFFLNLFIFSKIDGSHIL